VTAAQRFRVVFRADGSPSIGAGHVMRCLALAEALGRNPHSVGFAASAETFTTVAALRCAEWSHLVLTGGMECEPGIIARQWPNGVDVLVLDHYGRGASFERACRPWANRIVVLDDLADREHDADVLVNAGAGTALAYRGLVSDACRVLVGPQFAVVRDDFRRARADSLTRRDGRSVERILVGFGQTDPENATALALDALQLAGFSGEVDVVLGGAAPHLAQVRKKVAGRASLHIDTSDMPALLASADLAMGAAGTMAWERCCVGLPSIVVMTAENQRANVAELAKAGAILDAGLIDGNAIPRLRDALRRVLGGGALIELANRAAELVDGHGAERLLTAIGLA
jgi:UDP-2,4-diacetamido-2,4,6-trideoxy-beta-L-altropyranose hydrolase